VLTYYIEHIYDLVELKFFANMTTKSIERQMDCLEDGDKKACILIGRAKCTALYNPNWKPGMKNLKYIINDPKYYNCMKEVYDELYGEDNLEFCRYAFGIASEVIWREHYFKETYAEER
jgi:hypothetical protein